MNDGPDVWCYDALALPRIFATGSRATTILCSLEVIVTEFDSNPAVHTTFLLSRRAIEDYLATASDDDEVARYVRERRTPGVTTLLALESATGVRSWTVDGVAPHGIPVAVPGDPHAGLIDEARTRELFRAVVPAGTRQVRIELDGRLPWERTVEVLPGVITTVPFG